MLFGWSVIPTICCSVGDCLTSPEDAITAVTGHQEARTQIVVVTSSILVIGLLSVLFTVAGWEVAVFGRTVLHM